MRILIPIMLLSLSLCAHAAPRGVSYESTTTNVIQTVHQKFHSLTNLAATASTIAGYDANKKVGSLTAADVRTLLSVPIFDLTDPGAVNIFPFWDDAQNEVDWTSNTALLTLLGIDSNDNVTFGTVTATTVTATTLAGGGAGITYDGSGNNGNLATSINTLQELNDAVDNLSLGGGGGVSDGDKGDIVISGTGTVYTIDANSVALGTDSTGNYAAGDGEAGAALTGDSATGFFPAGTLELARGGTGASLSDPNADRLMFWDDSAGAIAFLTLGTSLTITGTTIDASGASAPTGTMVNSGASTQYAIPYYADTSGTNMVPSLITTDATKTNLNAGSVSAGDLILTNVATSLSNIGLGTEDSPQFTGIELGHATDTTLARSSAGNASIEGNVVVRQGHTLGGEVTATFESDGSTAVTLADSITVTGWAMGASTATTPSAADNDTSLATTAFVQTEVDGTQTGVHATPSTTNPLAPTWSGPMHTVWYGATGEIDLPAAAGYTGRAILIYNTGAFTITIDPNGSEVIVRDGTVQTGGVTFTLSSGAGNYVGIISDGARWITLGFKGTLTVGS